MQRKNVRIKRRPAVSGRAPGERSKATAKTRADTKLDPVGLAKKTLQSVCLDVEAPAAARAQAARTLLELAGAIGRHAPEPAQNTPSEMSLQEIDERLAALDDPADEGTADTRPARDARDGDLATTV